MTREQMIRQAAYEKGRQVGRKIERALLARRFQEEFLALIAAGCPPCVTTPRQGFDAALNQSAQILDRVFRDVAGIEIRPEELP